jgi:hypothetical protein
MPTPDTRDGDSAFARLEELVAKLPEIQERDKVLMLAREARNLLAIDKRIGLLRNEIANYDQIFQQALLDAKAAMDSGDKEVYDYNFALIQIYNDLKGSRQAPLQRSEDELRKLLKASGLTLDDSLSEYALSDEDYQALEDEILIFQEEYKTVYEYCLSLDR